MIGFSLLAATVIVSLVGLAVLCVVATRNPVYHPVAAGMGTILHANPSADTQALQCSEGTLAGDWHMVETSRLCDAENLLDRLEACSVRTRELEIAACDKFIVRWR